MSDTTATKPLDAKRAELRAKGWNDEQITKILMDAEAQSLAQQPAATGAGGVAGQGVFSGVLSSLVAVAAHARDTIFSIRKDVETVFTGGVPLSVKAGATASLAVKAAVIGVLGFAAWQEWLQHIVYATKIAEANAGKAAGQLMSGGDMHFTFGPRDASPNEIEDGNIRLQNIRFCYDRLKDQEFKALRPARNVSDHELKVQAADFCIQLFYGVTISDARSPSIRDSDEARLQQSSCYQRVKPLLLTFGLTEDEGQKIALKNCPVLAPCFKSSVGFEGERVSPACARQGSRTQ